MTKELVKIFTVTKNETDLVADFVKYHGRVFGYNNIILIDNNSSCPIVLQLYKQFQLLGVTIEHQPTYHGRSQGEAFTKFMKKYKGSCDFLIGLDTDEFLQFPDFLNYTTPCNTKQRFEEYFQSLKPKKIYTKFNVVTYFSSVVDPTSQHYIDHSFQRPATDIITFRQTPAKPIKCFFRAESFLSTVNGCHNGKVSSGQEVVSDLCYVHFHDTGMRRSVERAREIIFGYGFADVDSHMDSQLLSLQQVTSNIGSHRVLEYGLFLSRTMTLEGLVKRGLWPKSRKNLHEMAKHFPSIYGFHHLDITLAQSLPEDWINSFDDMILGEPTKPKFSTVSTLIRDLLLVPPPNIALMLSGHLRNFHKRESFWKQFVADFPQVDIFVHTWSDEGLRGKKSWINLDNKSNNQSNNQSARARSVLRPVEMVVEDHEMIFPTLSFIQPGVDLYYTFNTLIQNDEDFTRYIGSQLYSIKKCFQLTQNSNKQYDIFIRLRGDSVIENFGNLVGNLDQTLDQLSEETLVMNGSDNHVHPGGGRGCKDCDVQCNTGIRKHDDHSNDVCDIMYFGKFKVMSKVCHMADHVKSLVKSFQQHNEKVSNKPEVKKHLKKFPRTTTVTSPKIYENTIKCFYPERLIREFMKDFWLISDSSGLVPRIIY